MDTVRAKFRVTAITKYDSPAGAAQIKMVVVRAKSTTADEGENGIEENRIFGKYTPSGEVSMTIHNPPASAFFELGQEYYADFSKAPETPNIDYPHVTMPS